MEPITRVHQAFLQLAFAIKLVTYAELGKLKKEEFDTDILIPLKKRNLSFRDGTFNTDDDIVLAAQNNYVLTLGFTLLVLNQVLEEAGYKADLPDGTANRDLRALVYMLRCAFAHDMMNPTWEARGPFARDMHLNLPSGVLSVDTRKLDGQRFDPVQIGGIEVLWEIRNEIEAWLSKPNSALESTEQVASE